MGWGPGMQPISRVWGVPTFPRFPEEKQAQTFRQALCFLKVDQQSNADQQMSFRNR